MKETGGWKGYPGRFFTLLRKLSMSTGWLVCHFVYFGVIEGCLHANLLFGGGIMQEVNTVDNAGQ
jgi:hypothetical protein